MSFVKIGDGIFGIVSEVKEEVRRYFEDKFLESFLVKPVLDGIEMKHLSLEDSLVLELPFAELEIKEAVWSCGGDKVRGHMGFPFIYFEFAGMLLSLTLFFS